MTIADPPRPVTPRSAARRTTTRILAGTSVVAVIGLCGWWATHPDALQPVGSAFDAPVPIGDSLVVTMFAQPTSGAVHLLGAEPVITENSADAVVRVLRCGNPEGLPERTTIGAERGRAEEVCATTGPARASTLERVSGTAPYLVVEVIPRSTGTVTVEGLLVEYRTGLQRGQQKSGLVVTISSDD